MKKVHEFQKTQNLMNEYSKLEDKITNYKKEQEKLSTEKNIIKQTYTKGIKKQEYKGYEDFEEKLKQDVDEYHIDPRDLEKEYEEKIQKIDSDLEKVEETYKFFCNDSNFKTITMEMKEMEEAIQDAENEKNIEIAKLDLQWNELMAKKDFDGALEKRQEKESTIKKFDKDIKELKDKLSEYAKFKEKLNEKLKEFTVEDFRRMNEMTTEPTTTEPTTEPKTTEPKTTEPKTTGPKNIYSNSHDTINAININAKEGKAYVTIIKKEDKSQEIKELDVEEIIENKKEILKNADVNSLLEKAGVYSRFQKFMARRKINPVIIEAINGNPDLMYDYIEAVVDEKEFPFDYKIDLTDSNLSKKTNSALNKLALRERKIEGNEVVGAKRLYRIRNLFRGIKNQETLETVKEPEKLPNIKEQVKVDLDEYNKQQEELINSAYSKLSQEQKDNLNNLSASDIQRLGVGIDYNTAYAIKKQYGNNVETKSTEQHENEQEQ